MHVLNAISVNFFSIRQLALLPFFVGKVHLSNWLIKYYPSGGYSFYFHLASTISWKVFRNVEASHAPSGKIEWKQSGGYTNTFHFCNHHNISFLTFNFAQIVEARSISIVFLTRRSISENWVSSESARVQPSVCAWKPMEFWTPETWITSLIHDSYL